MTHEPYQHTSKASTLASADLHQQCRDLLSEVDAFQNLLCRTLRNPQLVEVRQFRSGVNAELRMIEKLIENASVGERRSGEPTTEDPEAERRLLHVLRSSNLPFHQTVWGVARSSCVGLIAMGKRFYWGGEGWDPRLKDVPPPKDKNGKKISNKDRKSVFVDIVADDGEEWVKVSTISESRLLFEMAKKGWELDFDIIASYLIHDIINLWNVPFFDLRNHNS